MDLLRAASGTGALDDAGRREPADDLLQARAVAADHTARQVRRTLHVVGGAAPGRAAVDHADTIRVARAVRAAERAQRRGVGRRSIAGRVGLRSTIDPGRHDRTGIRAGADAPAIAADLVAAAVGGRGALDGAIAQRGPVAAHREEDRDPQTHDRRDAYHAASMCSPGASAVLLCLGSGAVRPSACVTPCGCVHPWRVAAGYVVSMRKVIALLAVLGCKPPVPETVNEPPRLAAEEACSGVDVRARVPVPPRPAADPYALPTAAALFALRDRVMTPATTVCDLADRILVLAATQGVEGGKRRLGGTAWVIPRVATAPSLSAIAIEAASTGCVPGAPTCTWKLASPAMPSIETVPDPWMATGGWVHGIDDMCRALPDDTIAFCSTAARMAYVELGCTTDAAGPVQLQLGIHDASLDRRYDLDVEVPVARLSGSAESQSSGARWMYRFANTEPTNGPYRSATLSIDLGATPPSAEIVIDGARETCVAFGLYRR